MTAICALSPRHLRTIGIPILVEDPCRRGGFDGLTGAASVSAKPPQVRSKLFAQPLASIPVSRALAAHSVARICDAARPPTSVDSARLRGDGESALLRLPQDWQSFDRWPRAFPAAG